MNGNEGLVPRLEIDRNGGFGRRFVETKVDLVLCSGQGMRVGPGETSPHKEWGPIGIWIDPAGRINMVINPTKVMLDGGAREVVTLNSADLPTFYLLHGDSQTYLPIARVRLVTGGNGTLAVTLRLNQGVVVVTEPTALRPAKEKKV